MKCKHMHKDAPENAICKDCYKTPDYPKWILAVKGGKTIIKWKKQ